MTQKWQEGTWKEHGSWYLYVYWFIFLGLFESPSQQCEFIRSIPVADKIFSQRRFKWKFQIGLKRRLFLSLRSQIKTGFSFYKNEASCPLSICRSMRVLIWNLVPTISFLWFLSTKFCFGHDANFPSLPYKGLHLTVLCSLLAVLKESLSFSVFSIVLSHLLWSSRTLTKSDHA